jgi:CheY-like chemotaxis protein
MNTDIRVLLVEDNEGDVELVKRALRRAEKPVSIKVANDGVDALALLRQTDDAAGPPHIILLDLNMPRMDGRRLLEVLKADPQLKFIPVVMLTSSQSPADIRACYERFASFYVVKPFDVDDFSKTVHRIIDHWRQFAQLPAPG